jgi:hypothetical protein
VRAKIILASVIAIFFFYSPGLTPGGPGAIDSFLGNLNVSAQADLKSSSFNRSTQFGLSLTKRGPVIVHRSDMNTRRKGEGLL